mmetsp:Transcript_14754/g.44295  ORF Transcript_14754/g.44295 Transcript_14754/m.44295 type:complete len:210 (+) Transcript_14754:1896-2525(+)
MVVMSSCFVFRRCSAASLAHCSSAAVRSATVRAISLSKWVHRLPISSAMAALSSALSAAILSMSESSVAFMRPSDSPISLPICAFVASPQLLLKYSFMSLEMRSLASKIWCPSCWHLSLVSPSCPPSLASDSPMDLPRSCLRLAMSPLSSALASARSSEVAVWTLGMAPRRPPPRGSAGPRRPQLWAAPACPQLWAVPACLSCGAFGPP